jgi:long-chain acyl-CoA synthetase
LNAGQLAYENLNRYGEYTCLHFEGESYTNFERMRYAQCLASVLMDKGVKPGEVVAVTMNNCPEVSSAFQAAWIIGAAILPIMPQLVARELNYILEHSEARVIITSEELTAKVVEAAKGLTSLDHILVTGNCETEPGKDIREEIKAASPIEGLHERAADDLALLVYTSGTTGKPKGVMQSHYNIISNSEAGEHLLMTEPKTVTLNVLPLAHVYGVLMMNISSLVGTVNVLHPQFETKTVFEDIEKFRVQRVSFVPTMFSYLINFPDRDKYDVSSLERVNSGGAPLPDEVRLEFEEKFNCVVTEGWGQSESTCVISSYREGETFRPGSAGRVVDGVDICVQDESNEILPNGSTGELCVKGSLVMMGYWKNEEATRNTIIDGWLHTGDIGHLDEDGYIYITDRKKDLIIKGGENISPREVEEAIYRHPAVAECAVVGIPCKKFGEDICAAIALRHGNQASQEEIIEHSKNFLNKFKAPTRVFFLDELPKSSVGKLLKREVRDIVLPLLEE